jgi:hypothetical protein
MNCQACAHNDRHGWTGLEGQAHCADCHWTWRSRRAAHCPSCCSHFTSYTASDLHDGPTGCIPPAEIDGLKLAVDGYSWRCADTHTQAISAPGSAQSPKQAA